MNNINFRTLKKDFHVAIMSKNPEDPEDAKHRRFKDKWLFISTLIALAIIYSISIFILIWRDNSVLWNVTLNGIIGITLMLSGYYVRGKNN